MSSLQRFAWAALVGLAPLLAAGAALDVAVTRLQVQARPGVPDLVCREQRPAARRGSGTADGLPSQEEIDAALAGRPQRAEPPGPARKLMPRKRIGEPLQVALWGDSHLAAAFFTEELVRLLTLEPGGARPMLLPAALARPGVRLPLRRSCVSAHWRHEAAYASTTAAERPGPGLSNMVATDFGAELAFDLRNPNVAPVRQLRLLYEGTRGALRIGLSVDNGPETEVRLEGAGGPAALEINADAPLSIVRMRLLQGPMRFHGLELMAATTPPVRLDVFGFPGATAGGWKQLDKDYFAAWFGHVAYDVVGLEFGTNEGNASPFDAVAYRQSLEAAVRNLRDVFPAARCVLLGPGDRGVLVPQRPRQGGVDAQAADTLLKYTRVHEEITRIQQEVAARAGCDFWSAFEAMGGAGSAYRWARATPALMAPDLIHFTVKGYQRLAQDFAETVGWSPARIWGSTLPPVNR